MAARLRVSGDNMIEGLIIEDLIYKITFYLCDFYETLQRPTR